MGGTRGALSLVGALLFAGGCAHDFVDGVDLRVGPAIDATATMRIDVIVYAVRDYPDCTIFSPAARGTIDGLPLELKSHGAAASGMVFSGIELPPPKKCAGGTYLTRTGVEQRPAGLSSTIRIEDGARFVEITVANLRAAYKVEVDRPEAAAGERVTLHVTPRGDPPLPVGPDAKVSVMLYGPGKTVAKGEALVQQGRSVSFTVPKVQPGAYRVSLGAGDPPLRITRCVGLSKCEASRSSGPGEVALTIR
jgi:hypothetical protein